MFLKQYQFLHTKSILTLFRCASASARTSSLNGKLFGIPGSLAVKQSISKIFVQLLIKIQLYSIYAFRNRLFDSFSNFQSIISNQLVKIYPFFYYFFLRPFLLYDYVPLPINKLY